jgi:uncharacterized RDD family membrane protein YckC
MTALIDTVLEIDTPEHLAFRTRIAGPGRRMFAYLIDLIIRVTIFFLLALVFEVFLGLFNLSGFGTFLTLILFFLLDWFYFFTCEMLTGGRSPGKIALKLRVVRPNGLPITWRESFLRNLIRAADLTILPTGAVLLLGPIVMALDPKFRRLGDLVADTIVVVEEATSSVARQTAVQADEAMLAELPGSLPLDHNDLEALELFVNREHMSEARREELAEIVAGIYADKLHVPRPKNPTGFLGAIWQKAQDPRRRMV